MQMTPVLTVRDPEGGHRILIETDHAKVGEECLRADYITAPGEQTYESLGWLNGMKLILTVEHGATVTAVRYRETGYDTAPEGVFRSDDPFFNKFWQKGLRTIYVNSRDTFFDCPERERGQWWGDIVVILNECFYTYSTSLHALVRKGIEELCGWQRPDGSIYSPIPGNYGAELPCQMLAAVGRYGFWTYYMNTGDKQTIVDAYPAVKRYLALYQEGEDGMNLLRTGNWTWGDWGDNIDMRLLQNTWYCLALDAAAFLHLGISFNYRLATSPECNLKDACAECNSFLDRYFPTWRNSPYISLKYARVHGRTYRRLLIVATVYKLNLFPVFISAYSRIIKTLNIDIKW